jgi:uncharacterized protein (TIGR02001 family)
MIGNSVRSTGLLVALGLATATGAAGEAFAQAQPQPQTQQAQAAPAADWGALSGTVAVMSDYVFRGISQTQGGPALQAGLEYTKEFGMFAPYAGTFLSNADFPDTTNNTDLKIDYELDLYAGLRVKPIDPLTLDVGYIRYYYPKEDAPRNNSLGYDWSEVYLKGIYDAGFAKATLGWWHSQNYSSGAGKGNYYSANVDVPLPWELTATGHIGRLNIQNEVNLSLPDYTDWSLGVSRAFDLLWGSTVALTYSDTSVKRTSPLSNSSDRQVGTIDNRWYNQASPRVFLSVTKTF